MSAYFGLANMPPVATSSGSNLHRRVEVDLPPRPPRKHGTLPRSRRSNPIRPHATEMKLNRPLNASKR